MSPRLASNHGKFSAAAALGLACVLAIATGVAPLDVVRFIAFHLIWVLGPGILAARLLLPRRGSVWLLVLGWGLGYALEMGAYAGSAATGQRDLFLVWPAVAAVVAIAAEPYRRRRAAPPAPCPAAPRGSAVVLALLAAFLLVHFAAIATDEIGLPTPSAKRVYSPDFAWNLALAGEAKLRWPIRDPIVDAAPLPYHIGSALDAAAASRVTGIGLPVVTGRLQPVPLIFAVVLGLSLAGGVILGSVWAGPVGLAIVLLAGDSLGVIPGVRSAFRPLLTSLSLSPSFLFSLALYVPALLLMQVTFARRRANAPPGAGSWAALGILLCGCALAKSVLGPIVAATLVLLTLVTRQREGLWDRRMLYATAMAIGVLALSVLTVYAGASTTLKLQPLQGLFTVPAGLRETAAGVLLSAIAIPLCLVAAIAAPLAGMRWVPWPPERGPSLLLCSTVVAVATTFVVRNRAQDQVYFLHTGFVSGGLLAGAGVERLWAARRVPKPRQGVIAGLVVCLLGAELAFAGLAWANRHMAGGLTIPSADLVARAAELTLLTIAWGLTSRKLLQRSMSGYVVPLALVTMVLAAATVQTTLLSRELRIATGSHLNAASGAHLQDVGRSSGASGPRLVSFERIPLPGGVERGLAWIRGHTPPDARLIVSDLRTGREVLNNFGYAAFSERRTVMGGTIYTSAAGAAGYNNVQTGRARPYALLERLQAAVYERCDGAALAELVSLHHASHLIIDRTAGPMLPCLTRLGRVVFDDGDLAVVRLVAR